jgi:hypothetical protein
MKNIKFNIKCLAIVLAVSFSLMAAGCSDSDDLPPPSPPAPTSGTLNGTADDGTKPLDEYVEITITPTGGGDSVVVQCDANGAYSTSLTAGTYDLTATRPGYANYSSSELEIKGGETTTHDFSMTALAANTYIGTSNCVMCHATKVATFVNSAHPYKLNKVVNDTEPTYPFSAISNGFEMLKQGVTDNTLGTPTSYADISYVIGGFGWKARWMDANGYIITGDAVQYNLINNTMSAYHAGEVDKPYNCGNCHTTGWKHFDETNNPNRQDNLPGIDGTFSQPGIQCESCHGAASTHAQTKLAADITKIATARTTADFLAADMAYGKPVACSECHTRDGEKDYSTYVSKFTTVSGLDIPGGRIQSSGDPELIRHHEQYDEILAVNPASPESGSTRTNLSSAMWNCLTCHNTHTTTVYQDISGDPPGAANLNSDCMVCHPTNDPNLAKTFSMKGLTCMNCHMPKMVKSATSTAAVGTGPVLGDIKVHLFKIDMTKDSETEQFSGGFANPWITKKFACLTCHNGVTAHDRSTIDDTGYDFH